MFLAANTAQFTIRISDTSHDFKVLAFYGREAISTVYKIEIECVSERPNLNLESLLNKPAFLSFGINGEGIHGLLQQVEHGESGKRLTHYHLTLVPQLAYLQMRTNHRIFQHLSVQEIIEQILQEHGILSGGYNFRLNASAYPKRTYCVQYGESDLHFVQRLCEEEGIHFHFEHQPSQHVLVFADDQTGFPELQPPTAYQQDTGLVADEPVVKRFRKRLATRISQVAQRDYNFDKPSVKMAAESRTEFQPMLERYEYPGRFGDRDRGRHLAKRALERDRADYALASGESDQPVLRSGHFLKLTDHPLPEWNDLWLLWSVEHEGRQPQVLEESVSSELEADGGFNQGYRNSFTATVWDVPYRPALRHPKPLVLSTQTAVVCGPAGEEIYCDRYGRVKVQFFWDRSDQNNEKSSCWVRVASSWASNGFGNVTIPRVGMEVVVNFFEGDPDQPVITGCLPHAANMGPYDLPEAMTRTSFKTQSSPGGGGFNELRFEDKAGQEQVFIHAQRDQDTVVGNNASHSVGVNQAESIGNDKATNVGNNENHSVGVNRVQNIGNDKETTVGNNETHSVGVNRVENIGRDKTTTVTNNETHSVGVNLVTNIGQDESVTVGQNRTHEVTVDDQLTVGASKQDSIGTTYLIEAGSQIRLVCGASVLELNASGAINLSGTTFNFSVDGDGQINTGGRLDLNV